MATIPAPDLSVFIKDLRVRTIVYASYLGALFLIGALEVGFRSAGAESPLWLVVAAEVSTYVGAAIAGLALANRSTPQLELPERNVTVIQNKFTSGASSSEVDALAKRAEHGDGLRS